MISFRKKRDWSAGRCGWLGFEGANHVMRLGQLLALVCVLAILPASALAATDVKGDRLKIGKNPVLSGEWATIAGGMRNSATGFISVVSGGTNNFNGGKEAVIAGGRDNYIESAKHTVIGGGHNNAILTSMAEHATIGGGERITNNAMWATIAGGFVNLITENGESSTIGGGFSNIVDSEYAFIGGGTSNLLRDNYGVIAGGWGNIDLGYYGVISGGAYNFITNNNIGDSGDGAFIGGGSWNTNAGGWGFIGSGSEGYISGQFHVIVGGIRNKIFDGASATIGGGERNQASSPLGGNVIGGGIENLNFGLTGGTIAGGEVNAVTVDSFWGSIGGGYENSVTNGIGGVVAGGSGNLASADYATVPGGTGAHARQFGQMAHSAGEFVHVGDAQASQYVLRRTTSNSATNELFLDGGSMRLMIPAGGTWTFDVQVVARSGNNSAGFRFEGVVENVSGVASLLAANRTVLARDVGTWEANLSAINNALVIQVNGDSTPVRWVATVRTTEVQN